MSVKKKEVLTFDALEKNHWEAALALALPPKPDRALLHGAFDELQKGLDHLPFPHSAEEVEAACAYVQQMADKIKEIFRAWPIP